MSAAIYRIQDLKLAGTGDALVVSIVPASSATVLKKLEVGDYLVVHKDNGPPEEKE